MFSSAICGQVCAIHVRSFTLNDAVLYKAAYASDTKGDAVKNKDRFRHYSTACKSSGIIATALTQKEDCGSDFFASISLAYQIILLMKGFSFGLLLFISYSAFSQWNSDSLTRNIVCNAARNQFYARSCSDGSGGAIFTWVDERAPNPLAAVYAQRITRTGKMAWPANGIVVYDPALAGGTGADNSAIVADGFGGAIIVYEMAVNGGARQLYAQHINAGGTALWPNAVKITDLVDSRLDWIGDPEQDGISPDGSGGAFITWQAYNSPVFIYAQHINASGNLVWGSTGVGLPLLAQFDGYRSTIQNTGAGTAVVGFSSLGGGSFYMERLAANGSYMWGSSGLLVSDIYVNQNYEPAHRIIYDSASSAIMTAFLTQGILNTSNADLTIQKIDLNGNFTWKAGGINITKLTGNNNIIKTPDILTDSKGGIFIAYDSNYRAKVQHINSKGKPMWGTSGITIDNLASSSQYNPTIVSDGGTGFIVTYNTTRSWAPGNYPIYGQHYSAAGTALWQANGVAVIANYAIINHEVPYTIASTKGYAITCWSDERNLGSSGSDIYAARFGGATGLLPPFAPIAINADANNIANTSKNSILQLQVYPNPVKNTAHLSFAFPTAESNIVITLFDNVANKVTTAFLGNMAAGKHGYDLNIAGLSAGVYQLRLKGANTLMQTKIVVIK